MASTAPAGTASVAGTIGGVSQAAPPAPPVAPAAALPPVPATAPAAPPRPPAPGDPPLLELQPTASSNSATHPRLVVWFIPGVLPCSETTDEAAASFPSRCHFLPGRPAWIGPSQGRGHGNRLATGHAIGAEGALEGPRAAQRRRRGLPAGGAGLAAGLSVPKLLQPVRKRPIRAGRSPRRASFHGRAGSWPSDLQPRRGVARPRQAGARVLIFRAFPEPPAP